MRYLVDVDVVVDVHVDVDVHVNVHVHVEESYTRCVSSFVNSYWDPQA